ncbi:hypothetical protein SELMODRAFT_428268 [Selaginella moellendorffii]|uniref:Uncharacterized protein n=1 Tax=Selaginella moellendorffii TaxID=88036 RepID=D8T2A3_SELML|nr:hypothetical protein SELMODRAFT_428268 [Selaginella moellendorffii]
MDKNYKLVIVRPGVNQRPWKPATIVVQVLRAQTMTTLAPEQHLYVVTGPLSLIDIPKNNPGSTPRDRLLLHPLGEGYHQLKHFVLVPIFPPAECVVQIDSVPSEPAEVVPANAAPCAVVSAFPYMKLSQTIMDQTGYGGHIAAGGDPAAGGDAGAGGDGGDAGVGGDPAAGGDAGAGGDGGDAVAGSSAAAGGNAGAGGDPAAEAGSAKCCGSKICRSCLSSRQPLLEDVSAPVRKGRIRAWFHFGEKLEDAALQTLVALAAPFVHRGSGDLDFRSIKSYSDIQLLSPVIANTI